MINKILDTLLGIIKVLAALGVFAAVGAFIKKTIAKFKQTKKDKEEDRKRMMDVLEAVGMIEPRLKAIDVKLKDLSENQKAVLNMQNIAFLVFDKHGQCEYASPSSCDLVKFSESRILYSGWLALLIDADKERIGKAWHYAIETVTVFDEIFTYRGSNETVHCIAFHKKDENGDYNGSFAQLKKYIP